MRRAAAHHTWMSLNGSDEETSTAYRVGVGSPCAWGGTQRPSWQCARVRPLLSPATCDGSSMEHLSVKFNNGHSGVLVRIQLHGCKSAISLDAYLRKVSNSLEERDQVRLGAVRGEIANADGSVVLWRLLHDCLVGERSQGTSSTQKVHRGRSRSRSSSTTHW